MAEVTYYFDVRGGSAWDDPDYMIDNILTTYASCITDLYVTILWQTDCPGTDLGTISKVELRAYGYGDGDDRIDFYFGGTPDTEYQTVMPTSPDWGAYKDVTADPVINGWTWAKIKELPLSPDNRLRVEYGKVGKANTMYCAKVEVRVTYVPVGPTETIVAKEFPMGYYQTTGVKELRSKVSGATIAEVAKNFPHILEKSGKAKTLISKWS